MPKSQKKKLLITIWELFTSLKLTIALLIILAAASILGTLIPQGQGVPEFATGLSPTFQRVFIFLDLFDMYHSVWFKIILAALILNLIVCSINRFPSAWKRFKSQPRPDRDKPFENLPAGQMLFLTTPLKEVDEKLTQLFNSKLKRVKTKQAQDRIFLYGEKGRYSHFGVYLVHMSVIVILLGALLGSIFGFEAFVKIAEGERVGSVILGNHIRHMELGFEVQCDDFHVEFYDNGTPSEYRSDLSFFVDGEEVVEASIRVNHPFEFRGITFYQSTYGTVAGDKVTLRIEKKGGKQEDTLLVAERGDSIPLPWGEAEFEVLDIQSNFKGVLGPAALVSVNPDKGEKTRFWVFKERKMLENRFPKEMLEAPILNPSSFEPYTFHLEQVESRFYTGLQANRDPGVPVVWAGFFLMVAGVMLTFFTSHRRIWARLSPSAQETRLSIAGTANKNPVGLQREIKALLLEAKKLFPHRDEEND